MTSNTNRPTAHRQQGIVLPMAMIMLVILSFAGLMAAKNSASHEQFSNNIRTSQVSSQAAEAGLRYCERVAIDSADPSAETVVSATGDMDKVIDSELTAPDDAGAAWRSKANWVGNSLITASTGYSGDVQEGAKLVNAPTCIIQKMDGDSFVVTARGLSNDAEKDEDGVLTNGSEVWLQSIVTPGNLTLFN